MILNIIFFISGLALILLGANGLTDGASSIARRLKVSELVIGLTIVAFGTSAPELAVSTISALGGNGDIAIGNVIGSNLFNTLMIVGCTVLVRPIMVSRQLIRKEIPLCILASFVLYVLCADISPECTSSQLSRVDGLILLCFMAIFLSHTFSIAKNENSCCTERAKCSDAAQEADAAEMPLWRAILFTIGGLLALVFGGEIFVRGASGIARGLGASESLIALTIVAGGTSLPELATSVVAALKGKSEMAIGNVVGSNLFNIFLILGVSATITPINLVGIASTDLAMTIISSILLWLVSLFIKERTITRAEGAMLVAVFIGYTTWLLLK